MNLQTKKENSSLSLGISKDQLITIEHLKAFESKLIEEIKNLLTTKPNPSLRKCLKSSEVKQLLGISSGTLQNLRVSGALPFTRVGRLIFYKQEDIEKLLSQS